MGAEVELFEPITSSASGEMTQQLAGMGAATLPTEIGILDHY
jgi:hypothetical protein